MRYAQKNHLYCISFHQFNHETHYFKGHVKAIKSHILALPI